MCSMMSWVFTMSWVGSLLKDSELFILFAKTSQILLKIYDIPILLTFIYLVALNLLVNNQLNSSSNSSLRHIIVTLLSQFSSSMILRMYSDLYHMTPPWSSTDPHPPLFVHVVIECSLIEFRRCYCSLPQGRRKVWKSGYVVGITNPSPLIETVLTYLPKSGRVIAPLPPRFRRSWLRVICTRSVRNSKHFPSSTNSVSHQMRNVWLMGERLSISRLSQSE